MVFENKVLRRIFGTKRDEITGEWKKLHNAELYALYCSPDIIRNYTLSKKVLKYSAGLAPEFVGPLRVKKKFSPVRYELETLDGVPCGIWYVKDLKVFHHRS